MILKQITLENIRSYKDPEPIKLPLGSTLFEGDIGSGKSTILSAIEFALFGLGDVDGEYLLRKGARTGSVLLEFDVDRKSYQSFRSLVAGKNKVNQDEGYIIEGDTKTDYGVNEMKSRILEIIGINERPQAKTTSLIYRFAIFTPQEMMKQVLLEDPERRLETLRRGFGIEEYSLAKKNIDIVYTWIGQEVKIANKLTEDIPSKRTNLQDQTRILGELNDKIESLSTKIQELNKEVDPLEKKYEVLEKKKELVVGLEQSIPMLEKSLTEKDESLTEALSRLKDLEDELDYISKAERLVATLKPKYDEYISNKSQAEELETSIKEYEKLEKEKTKLEKAIDKSKDQLESKIESLESAIKELETSIEADGKGLSDLNSFRSRLDELETMLKKLPEKRKENQSLTKGISKLENERENRQEKIKEQEQELQQIVKIGLGAPCPKCKQKLTEKHIDKLKAEFEETKSLGKKKIDEIAKKIDDLGEQSGDIDTEIQKLEEFEEQVTTLRKKVTAFETKEQMVKNESLNLDKKREELSGKQQLLKEGEFALEEKERLLEVTKHLNKLEIDKSKYEKLKERVKDYEKTGNQLRYIESSQQSKQRPECEKRIEKTNDQIKEIEQSIKKASTELEGKRRAYEENKGILEEIEDLDQLIEAKKDEIGKLKEQQAATKADFQSAKLRKQELEVEIKKKDDTFRRKQMLDETESWFDKCFAPSVDDIERHMLASLNEEFNQMFQQWFNALIETGDIAVEVDETFSPLITQNGYQLKVNNLSGGERTSVALAYRLALNVLIRKTAALKSELLILDEPTDGFSSQQLIKLRQVLDQLNTTQIIMVSHERELETFVDNVCKVTKEGGISKVQLMQST